MSTHAVPVKVVDDPPPTLATLASALNLAIVLELHRADLAVRGMEEMRTSRGFLFTKLTALAVHLASHHQSTGLTTLPWTLACDLLLPDHGRQPTASDGWTVSRTALKADFRVAAIPCALIPGPDLPKKVPDLGVTNATGSLLLSNWRDYQIAQSLVKRVPSALRIDNVRLFASELHVILLDLMDDIAYSGREQRRVAFLGLYLLLLHDHCAPRRYLHQSLRSLYLALPVDGAGPNNCGKTRTMQRDWHLSLKVQSGSGGVRDPEHLLREYEETFEDALEILDKGIEGPHEWPDSFPSTAASLGKSAYHPVARLALL
ncbi:hypothetical protein JCM11251_003840 [Rhodosporidiobolus azoricus]